MGMSTHIKGFVSPNNETYMKHTRIWEMCKREDVSLPKETKEYFLGCDTPEDKLDGFLKKGIHYHIWNDTSSEGFEVDLTKLPKEITILRFYNSF